jgi:F0F1-type ATP synthase membrane subunit b/b'
VFVGKLVDMFDKRHDLTAGSRHAAEHAVKSAEVKIAEYESRIGEVRRNAIEETKRIRHESEGVERQTIEAAKAAANLEIEKGRAELTAVASKAQLELDTIAQAAGEKIATKVLGGAA